MASQGDAGGLVQDVGALIRIQAMLHSVSDQVSPEHLDTAAAERLQALHASIREDLSDVLGDELRDELARYVKEPASNGESTSSSNVALTHAQLRGWLDGLVSAMQLTARAAAQQQFARAQAGGAQPAPDRSAESTSRAYL